LFVKLNPKLDYKAVLVDYKEGRKMMVLERLIHNSSQKI
jgi:hypothetical protein